MQEVVCERIHFLVQQKVYEGRMRGWGDEQLPKLFFFFLLGNSEQGLFLMSLKY